jgi:anti-sigma regulatory factor (Ser/Thr protein kinase)
MPSQEGGRGLWMANQVCDLVRIRSGATGTAIRLHMSLN